MRLALFALRETQRLSWQFASIGALGVLEGVVQEEEPVRAVQIQRCQPTQNLLFQL